MRLAVRGCAPSERERAVRQSGSLRYPILLGLARLTARQIEKASLFYKLEEGFVRRVVHVRHAERGWQTACRRGPASQPHVCTVEASVRREDVAGWQGHGLGGPVMFGLSSLIKLAGYTVAASRPDGFSAPKIALTTAVAPA